MPRHTHVWGFVARALPRALPHLHQLPTPPAPATPLGAPAARTDEIGVPFALTVDFKSLEDSTVTVRERDSTTQVGLR